MADHSGAHARTEPSVAQHVSDSEPGATQTATRAAESNGGATFYVLGLFIAGLGVVHLIKRRFFPALVPDWLGPVRHEIDMATGGMKVLAGVVVMLIPLLRRWGSMAPADAAVRERG